MKTCSYCGNENDDAAAKCFDCGTSLPMENTAKNEGEYEFSQEQQRIIGGVGSSMRIVGLVLLVVGGLCALIAVLSGNNGQSGTSLVGSGIQGMLALTIGTFTWNAGSAFRRIVSTQGNDLEHLMEAMGDLGSLYRLQLVVWVITMLLLGAVVSFIL